MSILASFTIANNAGIASSIVNAVQGLIQSAIDAWAAVLAGNSTSNVTITFADTVPSGRAQGGNETIVSIGTFAGRDVVEPGTAYELRTGLEHTQSGADIHIIIAKDYLLNELYLDSTLETAGDIPNNRTDAYSAFLHEIGHAIGFIGYYNEGNDSFSYNANSPYDTRLILRSGEVFFDGPNVRTVYGDAVPLTNDYYTHYGNTIAYPGGSSDLLTGMMNGMVYHRGYRYSISALDLAIMADNGVGTIQNDRFSVNFMKAFNGGSGIDTVDFLSATSAIVFSLATPGPQVTSGMGSVTLVGIENLIGSAYDDTLTGDGAVNTLSGADGNDLLLGGGSSDTLHGEAGADILQGGNGNDLLIGGGGADTFRDTSTGLNGDTILDFRVGDRIVITDASLAGFLASIADGKLTFTGGSINLGSGRYGDLSFAAAAGGGVQLQLITWSPTARNDFNGDGRSDILWRDTSGTITNWLGQANGGFAGNNANLFTNVDPSWTLARTGDFNGDGRADVLWRHTSGLVTDWLGQANGGFVPNNANLFTSVDVSWKIVGTGDFNGDGRDDVLFRHSSGLLTDWLGQANGALNPNNANLFVNVDSSWAVVATGDFNGDGRDDVLFRHSSGLLTDWLGQANGGLSPNANLFTSVDPSWKVIGAGDFNGDGRDDILWRHSSGALTNWLGQANGGFVANNANALSQSDNSWHVVGIGDYNGDGRDDLAWRHDSGAFSEWLGQATGGFASNHGIAANQVATSWQVQSPDVLFL